MKKIIFGSLFLGVTGIAILSCKKENNLNLESNDVTHENVAEQISIELDILKRQFETAKTTVDPSFSYDPHDAIGAEHNLKLAAIHDHADFELDVMNILEIFDENTYRDNLTHPITNFVDAENTVTNFVNTVLPNGEPDYEWFNTLDISKLEKDILVTYFQNMYSTNDIDLRIEMSKVVERIVADNATLSTDSKERMLIQFAIFRHSSHYWENFDDYAAVGPFAAYCDAVMMDLCLSGDFMPGGIDLSCSGSAYQFSQLFSAVVDALS